MYLLNVWKEFTSGIRYEISDHFSAIKIAMLYAIHFKEELDRLKKGDSKGSGFSVLNAETGEVLVSAVFESDNI